MKQVCTIVSALLLAVLIFAPTWSAEHPLLAKARAEEDPLKATALYWQYFDEATGDSSHATAADDFADLLADNRRFADLVRFGDHLLGEAPPLPSPLNTIAYALAQGDTALDKALSFEQAAVAAQRELVHSAAPPERSAKAWKERNQAMLGYYLDTYGFALLKKREAGKAREVLREAFSLTSSELDPEMCLHLAQAEWQLKNPGEALDWAIRALFYLGDRENEELQQVLRDSYALLRGSGDGFEDYVRDHLEQMRQEEYARLVNEKLDAPAPEFELKTLDGSTVRLSDSRGRIVLVDFWATWCGPCKRELPLLQAEYPKWKAQGIELLAISTDKETERVAPFIQKNGYAFPVLFSQGTSKAYDVSGIPMLFVVDAKGRIQYRHVGYRPDIVDVLNLQIAELSKHP